MKKKRKPTSLSPRPERTQEVWNDLAAHWAKVAHEDWFRQRLGWVSLPTLDYMILFNNHPSADDPTRRDRGLVEFRKWLADAGWKELAFATYPEDAYSFAMLIDTMNEDEARLIYQTYCGIWLKEFKIDQKRPKRKAVRK